jgi:4-amino-4-deoxy-L-arabinose transferase-like glycosyltransferase
MIGSPSVRIGLIVAMTLVGAWLRFRSFASLGLAHFDEGIYALGGLWSLSAEGMISLKTVIYYAPPGLPVLIGISYAFLGVSDWAAILVSIICGILSIPIVAWVARRTFGAGAGLAAATFAALSMPHIAFSRKALTDSPFLLFWLLAIGLGGWFLERPGFRRAVGLGLSVGIAQNVKYNGWLSGGLVLLSALLGLVILPEHRKRSSLARTFGWGLCAALVAMLVYAPWFLFVERNEGYSSLMSHHRSYLGSLGSWLPHWKQQLAQARALSGGTDWLLGAWTAAVLVYLFQSDRIKASERRSWGTVLSVVILFCLGGLAIVLIPNLSWWIGLGWSPWLLRSNRAAVRLLGCWWVVLTILTPFYHPYARLWLPTEGAGWLIMGGATAWASRFIQDARPLPRTTFLERVRHAKFAIGGALLTILALALHTISAPAPHPFPKAWILDPATSLRRIALHDLPQACPVAGRRVRVLARRPLAFYLLLAGANLQIEEDLDSVKRDVRPGDCLLLDRVLVGPEIASGAIEQRLEPVWKREKAFEDRLDAVTLLDHDLGVARTEPVRRSNANEILLLIPGSHRTRLDPSPPTSQEMGTTDEP